MFQLPVKKQVHNKNQQHALLILSALKQNRMERTIQAHNLKIKMMNKMNENAKAFAEQQNTILLWLEVLSVIWRMVIVIF